MSTDDAVGFPIVLRGYDRAQVDEAVKLAAAVLATGSENERARVRDVLRARTFRRVLRGYDRAQVDQWREDAVRRLS